LLPFAAVGSFLVDFLAAMAVLILLMLYYGVVPSMAIIWLPLLTLFAVVTALGVGTWLAAINVRYRDVKYVVPFLTQMLMFASPVIYATTLIPKQWQALYALNPMTGVLDGFRWALIGGPRPDSVIVVSAIASVLVFASALVYFRRTEQTFADVI
jgi:lipopolysaccharide transport system permease protein